MSEIESMSSRSYEARCARCDVTFPIETKICVHCGGSTGAGRTGPFGLRSNKQSSPGYSTGSDPFDSAYGMEDDEFVFREEAASTTSSPNSNKELGDGVESERSSPVKSLMRSMGGVIWVLLLIGFSLARSCGGE